MRRVPVPEQRHDAVRTRPARPRRRGHADWSRDRPVRPHGGGHTVLGLNDIKPPTITSCPGNPASGTCTAQTYMPELQYTWNGVDTNFNWRAPLGIRVQGGTDTNRTQRDTCYATLDAPNV